MAPSLKLTTTLQPATPFDVDGEVYHILGSDHLSPNDEAEAMALFARYNYLSEELASTPNTDKGKVIAERVRKCRLSIIGKLTDLPKEAREKLPLSAQAKLLEAIQAEIDGNPEEDPEDEDGDSTGGDDAE